MTDPKYNKVTFTVEKPDGTIFTLQFDKVADVFTETIMPDPDWWVLESARFAREKTPEKYIISFTPLPNEYGVWMTLKENRRLDD